MPSTRIYNASVTKGMIRLFFQSYWTFNCYNDIEFEEGYNEVMRIMNSQEERDEIYLGDHLESVFSKALQNLVVKTEVEKNEKNNEETQE